MRHPDTAVTSRQAPSDRASAGGGATSRDRRTITVVVAIQLAISLGYFAVMAHVVGHLRHDLGLLAGTVTLVLTVRVAVQNMLFLATGALTDALGPARAGALACALRAASFALLGAAEGLPGLLAAVILMAVGGALFHPAAQAALASTPPALHPRGFASYLIAGQLAAIAGPPLGLALLPSGFPLLTTTTTALWTASALLFLLLRPARSHRSGPRETRRAEPLDADAGDLRGARPPAGVNAPDRAGGSCPDEVRRPAPVPAARAGGPGQDQDGRAEAGGVDGARPSGDADAGGPGRCAGTGGASSGRIGGRGPFAGVSAVLRDRGFVRFALAAAPTTLLTTQVTTLVPLKETGAGPTTLFFCVVAVLAAAVQPWCGGPRTLRTGLLCAAAGYLVLLAGPADHRARLAVLVIAAALHGAAVGLTQPALFRAVTSAAAPHRFGVYFGLLSFLAGAFSLAGGLVVGPLLDSGPGGMTVALVLLSVLAALTAAAQTLAGGRGTAEPGGPPPVSR